MTAPPEPGPVESVWDYPRPPRIEAVAARITVTFAEIRIAETRRALRVLETSHPPVYYLPREDVRTDLLIEVPGQTFCEFKGAASYVTLAARGRRSERAGWYFADPAPDFRALAGHLAFYASKVDAAEVGGAAVRAQEGDFYGGWITDGISGPFKGGPGTRGW